jgi:catechol 2,3-dioxygenase-like lactoylglutathione lyase family enzyme
MVRGDCRLALYQGHLDPPRPQLIFWQGDVEAIGRALVAQGLTLKSGPARDAKGAALMILDPDEHPIFLINMPVRYVDNPGHARAMPPHRQGRLDPDPVLGWFEASLDVSDLDRSLAFYGALGFERIDSGETPRTATLRNGDCRLGLYQGYLDPARPQLIFWQGDVAAIARDCAAKGVAPFRGPATDAVGTGLMILDPDGHPIYVVNIPGLARREPAWRR